MVSAPSTPTTRRPGAHHKPPTTRSAPEWVRRLALGGAIALPYVLLAIFRGVGPDTPNAKLDRLGSEIKWGSSDLGFVRDMYPPLPSGIAGALPGGRLALGIAGALLAAFVLEFLITRLRRRQHPWWLIAPVIIGIGAMPVYARTAIDDLATFAGLAALIFAVAGLLEFTGLGDTGGGFRAGLALGIGVACDLNVAVYAVAIGVAAPLIARRRYQGIPYATQAAMLVLIFPACAALTGWAYLEWRFSGGAFHAVHLVGGGTDGLTATLLAIATSPVFLLSAVILLRQNAAAAVALAIPVLSLMISTGLGLTNGGGTDHIVLALIGAFTIAANPSLTVIRLYALAVVIQVGLGSVLA
ncbi:hypothetical protein [Actinoplanes friuliensis]|uniref:Uncharacterized protein n=1 Tax=Actinoplanes friuliensis DSM 7358 TaxID=1246995 RepID=U5VSV8_9ACTN|nr:hypothetical protein [Actinoplanes friuliensis]AGZ38810.1 hypothetical protein AFR_02605 [Actinoplanes friuliensis DSM 7358]